MSEEQRTDEWHQERLGKFTSSRISELMGIKGLNKTGESYAFSLAVELFVGKNNDDSFVSYDMQRGIDQEPYAFEKLQSLLAVDFIPVYNCGFIELNKNTGGTPDGLYGDYGVFDIKCPKPDKFFKIVYDDIIDQEYIDQLQHQMYISNRKEAISFQYLIYNSVEYWHKIVVKRDQERIDLMEERIELAVPIRDAYLSMLKVKKQW